MTLHIIRAAALFAALALVATTSAQPPLPPPDKSEAKKDAADQAEPGIQVAEKGPIHEAFAQPGAETRGKGMTAPKAPPAPIPELPPETKPDGANVKWVPGYWQWDTEKQDFLWVSGFWRNFPAGRDWQAGKWAEKDGKWSYNPGFWRPTNMNSWRVDLPEPPKSVESGPSTPADNPNAVWIPARGNTATSNSSGVPATGRTRMVIRSGNRGSTSRAARDTPTYPGTGTIRSKIAACSTRRSTSRSRCGRTPAGLTGPGWPSDLATAAGERAGSSAHCSLGRDSTTIVTATTTTRGDMAGVGGADLAWGSESASVSAARFAAGAAIAPGGEAATATRTTSGITTVT